MSYRIWDLIHATIIRSENHAYRIECSKCNAIPGDDFSEYRLRVETYGLEAPGVWTRIDEFEPDHQDVDKAMNDAIRAITEKPKGTNP